MKRLTRTKAFAEVVTQQQPAARIGFVDLEIARLARVLTLHGEAERAVAEQLVDAQRDSGLIRAVLAFFVVKTGAHTQQGFVEIGAKAQTHSVLVRVLERADQGFDGLRLRVGTHRIAATQGRGVGQQA